MVLAVVKYFYKKNMYLNIQEKTIKEDFSMTISKNLEGDKLTVAVEGRLDTVTAPDLESELKSALEGVKELVMDFTKLEYISSAGLRVLLAAFKKMDAKGGKMKLTNINEMVREVLDVTGLMSVLTVE